MLPLDLPASIRALAERVQTHGGRAYVVGGGVRDHLLGLPVKDWDVEVFGVTGPDLVELLRPHGSVNTVGKSFGVYKWRPRGEPESGEIDVSIPRRDSKVGRGHRGIAVEGDPDMTVDEAARRRDLTINALMWDIVDAIVVDPSGGLDDLEARRLRAVDSATFLEDPLRALRAVQFAARLGFDVDPSLLELCRTAALDELPAERVQGEWGKLLLKATAPSVGLRMARDTEILDRVFPEVAHATSHDALDRLARHTRGSLPDEGAQWTLMLAGWLHEQSLDAVEATLDRLWMHTVQGYPVRVRTMSLVAEHDRAVGSDTELRHASVHAPLRLLLSLQAAVHDTSRDAEMKRADALGILDQKPAPLLQGRHLKDLGVEPGPFMGELIRVVYAQQLDGVVSTLEQAQEAARAMMDASPPSST